MGKKILSIIVESTIEAVSLACFTFGISAFARMGWDFAGQDSHGNDPQNEEEA